MSTCMKEPGHSVSGILGCPAGGSMRMTPLTSLPAAEGWSGDMDYLIKGREHISDKISGRSLQELNAIVV